MSSAQEVFLLFVTSIADSFVCPTWSSVWCSCLLVLLSIRSHTTSAILSVPKCLFCNDPLALQDLRSSHFRHFFDILNILKNKSKYEKYEKSQKFKNTEWRFGSNQTTIFRVVYTRKVITITSIMFGCTIVVVLMTFVLLYIPAARFFY